MIEIRVKPEAGSLKNSENTYVVGRKPHEKKLRMM